MQRRWDRTYWRMVVFCAYFGHQPISEVRALTSRELNLFYSELSELVSSAPSIRFG